MRLSGEQRGPSEDSEASGRSRLRLGVLFSGTGRTLENLVACCRDGTVPAEVVVAISNRVEAPGNAVATRLGVPLEVIDAEATDAEAPAGEAARTPNPSASSFSTAVTSTLLRSGVDLVVLAGLLRYYDIPSTFRGRVLNIHPSLLPAHGGKGMYGRRVHEAVLAAGERFSGCTVHFAGDTYDRGPILLQRVVGVATGDSPETLGARVFAQECIAYPEALRLYAEGRAVLKEGRVHLRPTPGA